MRAIAVTFRRTSFVLLAALAGCSNGDDGDGGGAGSGGGSAGAGGGGADATTAIHGYFHVKIIPAVPDSSIRSAAPARTSILGGVADAATPVADAWQVVDEAAGCTLSTPAPPFCSDCVPPSACVSDEVCVPAPAGLDIGPVHVSGLGTPFDLTDEIVGKYATLETLPYPPCAEGDAIHLVADGGDYASFTIDATCVAPLEFPGPVMLTPGAPLALRWTPAAMPDLARVQVHLDVAHHGGARGQIECDVPDSGALDIPASLTDALVDLGVAGFPSVVLTRSVAAHGSTDQASDVVLTVSSSFENLVEIPGLTSCTDDTQCPTGETCQSDFRCGS